MVLIRKATKAKESANENLYLDQAYCVFPALGGSVFYCVGGGRGLRVLPRLRARGRSISSVQSSLRLGWGSGIIKAVIVYNCCIVLRLLGLFRQICSNGAKITLAGVGSRAIHTKHEVARVLEEVAKSNFTGDAEWVKALTAKKLDTKIVAKILGTRVPEKWQKELALYAKIGDNTAWAWMNGLSYIATHEYSLTRSRQLDPVMAAIQNLAT